MKVTCRNCGKRFDYDTYTGLCPKCSTYYRIDSTSKTSADTYTYSGTYSEPEEDIYDDFEEEDEPDIKASIHTPLQTDTENVRFRFVCRLYFSSIKLTWSNTWRA